MFKYNSKYFKTAFVAFCSKTFQFIIQGYQKAFRYVSIELDNKLFRVFMGFGRNYYIKEKLNFAGEIFTNLGD